MIALTITQRLGLVRRVGRIIDAMDARGAPVPDDIRAGWERALESFHMPGKHNQKDHARKGAAGREAGAQTGGAGGSSHGSKDSASGKQAQPGGAAPAENNKDALAKFGEEQSKAAYDGMNDNEKSALYDYKTDYYLDINRELRAGNMSAETRDRVEQMDAAIGRATLTEPATVYRCVSANVLGDGDLTGKVISDRAYTSTSLDRDVANGFTKWVPNAAVVEIRVPKGSSALYMEKLPGIDPRMREGEMLLPRESRFRVVSDSGSGSNRNIVLEVIP